MARTHVVMDSIHPRQIDAYVLHFGAQGWSLMPPWPDETGVAYFTAPDGTPAPHLPVSPITLPPQRSTPAPARNGWPAIATVLGLVTIVAALAGWLM